MTPEQKGRLMGAIIAHLRFAARAEDRAFSDGEVFLALAFRTDEELERIARLAGAS